MSPDTRRVAEPPGRVGFAVQLTRRAVVEYFDDRGPQMAASVAYHVLFSIFPLAIVLTGIFGLVVHLTGVKADVVDTAVRNVPVSASGEKQLRHLLDGVTSGYSALSLFGLVGLVWAASGMMVALRVALNAAWDIDEARPFLKGKLIDVGLVFLVALGAIASTVATITVRAATDAVGSWLGVNLSAGWAGLVLGVLFPLSIAFATVFFLYRLIPATRVDVSPTWQVAGGVAVVFVVFQNVFALYVRGFADYNAVYGSLGTVIAFMFFVYLSCSIFLLGAEFASEWPRLRRAYELGEVREEPGSPTAVPLRRLVRGLWAREPEAEQREEDVGRSEPESRGEAAGRRSTNPR